MIANDTYMLEGTREELAVVLRCRVGELSAAMPNLKTSGIGDITIACNGLVTLVSRRLKREFEARENGRLRVAAHRKKRTCNTKSPSVSVSASSESPPREGGAGEGWERREHFPEVNEPPTTGLFYQMLYSEINKAYQRHPHARWNYEEERLLVQISRVEGAEKEWLEILAYHRKDPRFKRRTVLALLQNWQGELDKARGFDAAKAAPTDGKPKQTSILEKEMAKIMKELR